MNKYEMALTEVIAEFSTMRVAVKGGLSEHDRALIDTLTKGFEEKKDCNPRMMDDMREFANQESAYIRLKTCAPFFLEDLHEGMYVYDRKLKRIVMIDEITESQEIVFTVISNERLFDEICFCRYKDDRFFPVHALYVFEGEILHTPKTKPEYPHYLMNESKRRV